MNTPDIIEQKNDTLFAGRTVTVLYEDGNQGAVKVNQLRLAQYEEAFKALDNEFALLGLMCGQSEAWTKTLQPESYEALISVAMEVNAKGFFVYAERRHSALTKRLNTLSPQILNAATAVATSSTSSQRPRPRPA